MDRLQQKVYLPKGCYEVYDPCMYCKTNRKDCPVHKAFIDKMHDIRGQFDIYVNAMLIFCDKRSPKPPTD